MLQVTFIRENKIEVIERLSKRIDNAEIIMKMFCHWMLNDETHNRNWMRPQRI